MFVPIRDVFVPLSGEEPSRCRRLLFLKLLNTITVKLGQRPQTLGGIIKINFWAFFFFLMSTLYISNIPLFPSLLSDNLLLQSLSVEKHSDMMKRRRLRTGVDDFECQSPKPNRSMMTDAKKICILKADSSRVTCRKIVISTILTHSIHMECKTLSLQCNVPSRFP